MKYKILNLLFGWHYVEIYTLDSKHICRVTLKCNGDLVGTLFNRPFIITPGLVVRGQPYVMQWYPLTWDEPNLIDNLTKAVNALKWHGLGPKYIEALADGNKFAMSVEIDKDRMEVITNIKEN